ncbi:MAG: polyketide cyclase [Chitinophagaceae bacterium]|nr:polyketide cyclase [Chitinophagaceae bacterium]
MKEYSYITVWKLKNTSLDEVWKTIKAVDDWPNWWKGVVRVQTIKEGEANGIGKISELTFKSFLPYTLSFQSELLQLKFHECMIGKATGELEGSGVWNFRMENETIRIQYEWNVKTTLTWMNVFAPLLRPVFKWNHDLIMQWGLEGLAKKLNATIV